MEENRKKRIVRKEILLMVMVISLFACRLAGCSQKETTKDKASLEEITQSEKMQETDSQDVTGQSDETQTKATQDVTGQSDETQAKDSQDATGQFDETKATDSQDITRQADETQMDVSQVEAGYSDSPDWIASLGQEKGASQLLVVAGVGQTTAYVSMHEKDENGKWKELVSTPGYIGKKGLGKTREGDALTPQGTFHFNAAFGIAEDPGCAMPYHQVTKDDYWSGDPREGYAYNKLVSIKDYPDLDIVNENTEHIIDYVTEYQYCLNISYNEECIPGVGGAIFLHCLGKMRPYTGGCVAIPEERMIEVMKCVKPDCVVVIDSLKTLSPKTWNKLGLDDVR